MNERIQKLAEQAKFMAEEDINKQISFNTELKTFSEKFAKLIVAECCKRIRDELKPDSAYHTDWDRGMKYSIELIEKLAK